MSCRIFIACTACCAQDSEKLPFHLAEQYHQFHNGIGHAFPPEYTQDQKAALEAAGRIHSTGCPEGGGWF